MCCAWAPPPSALQVGSKKLAVHTLEALAAAPAPVLRRYASGRANAETGRLPDCRLKREEQRIAKEIEEREQEEARKLLEQAQMKKGVRKLNIADGAPLDKVTLMNQVTLRPESHALVKHLHHGVGHGTWGGHDSHRSVYLL